MIRAVNFLTPSLHPNTLLDISYPEPGPSSHEPLVRNVTIKHGDHQPVGHIKRVITSGTDTVMVADDALRISTLSMGSSNELQSPEVIAQYTAESRKSDIWAGLIAVQGGVVSALTSGQLFLYATSSSSTPIQERSVPSPLMALSSGGPSSTSFALAGKEVDVSVWDTERTFSSPSSSSRTSPASDTTKVKRKEMDLEPGEIWRARNLPNNSLSLRSPIHHLCLAHLPDSETLLVSGTKAGTVRRYDTRQRKPVSDWKVAKEGGVGCVASGAEHELYFADRSNLVGAVDLRTGRLLYSYSSMTSSAHHLLPLPRPEGGRSSVGLASIASDATMRLHTTVPPPPEGIKGNPIGEGKKPKIVGMVGGVGVGSALFRYWGEMAQSPIGIAGGGTDGEGDDDDDDGKVWKGMSEVGDDETESEDERSFAKRLKA